MLVRKLVAVVVTLGFLGLASTAFAQSDAGKNEDKTILNRLDDLGKTIFGAFLPTEKSKPKDIAAPRMGQQSSKHKAAATDEADDVDMPASRAGRAGSVLTESTANDRGPIGAKSGDADSDITPESSPPAVSHMADGTPKRVRRPLPGASLLDESDTQKTAAAPPRETVQEPSRAADEPIARPNAPRTGSRPLYERLSAFRQSVFDSEGARPAASQPIGQPERAPAKVVTLPPAPETKPTKLAVNPIVAQRAKPALSAVSAEPALEPAANSPTITEKTPAETTTPAPAKAESDGGLLIARKGPVLSVETLGPRRITIGKESTYEVNIVNSGEVTAEELVVFVALPEWAEVAGAETSCGAAQAGGAGQTSGAVQWKLGRLDAKGRERLTLRIIPRQSRPFDLAVRWDYKPVASQAMIEVQEPKLSLQLEGPREVLYGKKETYRLKLANVGSGGAENVAIMLMPIGGGENVPATHKIGLLAAGEEKVLDVELTARQSGNLTIQVDARADGGVRAELAEKVLVRRAGLKVDVEGPKVQYVGATTTYAIRVRNPGTAPARNVNLSIGLPVGAKYLSGIEGARVSDSGDKVEWTVDAINPAAEQNFMLKCSLGVTGVSRIQVNGAADDDLTATGGAVTRVEAVANLVMDVKDPEGPVAVGEAATYEIRVRNRGTREAAGVEVFAYFSRGIEPTKAEGGPNRLGPGQVTFQSIPAVAPGAEVVLKVHARADVAGNHVFRAEAHCKPLNARLISEATNLYYADTSATQEASRQVADEGAAPGTMRTVTRPIQGEQTIAPPRK